MQKNTIEDANFLAAYMLIDDYQVDRIGERLKEFRKNLGMSQQEMAERLGIGQTSYSSLERGTNKVSFNVLRKLATSYDIDFNWLIGGSEIPSKELNKSFTTQRRSSQILSPIPANAGIPFEYTQEWISDPEPVDIPWLPSSIVLFKVDGLSMLPNIEPGCYLGCLRLDSHSDVSDGYIYVIVGRCGIWVKRLYKDTERVHFRSDNNEYPSFTLSPEDIFELYKPIVKLLSFDQTSMEPAYRSFQALTGPSSHGK